MPQFTTTELQNLKQLAAIAPALAQKVAPMKYADVVPEPKAKTPRDQLADNLKAKSRAAYENPLPDDETNPSTSAMGGAPAVRTDGTTMTLDEQLSQKSRAAYVR